MAKLANREDVYKAAERWVDAALRHDDSLFTPGVAIWSAPVIEDLYERFVLQPDVSARSFEQKLRIQLEGGPPETFQLAGELLYFHLLITRKVGGNHKRNLINLVLSWSTGSVAIPESLASSLDQGIANTGTSFNTRRPHQLWFLIHFVRRWKELKPKEQQVYLTEPWSFKEFIWSVPIDAAQTQREALLHLVFPSIFEPITSQDAKSRIVKAFEEDVIYATEDVDRRLLQVREHLNPQFGGDFMFYDIPVQQLWKEDVPRSSNSQAKADSGKPISPLTDLAGDMLLDHAYLERVDELLQSKKQLIFYGPPGTGKTYVARELAKHYAGATGDVKLVQFHPSYAYEDFIEGFRPRQDGDTTGFQLVDGPLKKLAKKAADNPDATFVLVIDEINRGNVAKVLGELYFLLEYRDEEINLQYSSEAFSLPENLWIIGTMNTADRSIALIDAALRRRFYFVPFMPDKSPIEGLLRRWLERNKPELTWVACVVDRANRKLDARHMAIGPSYFMKPDLDERWVGLIWEHSILPYIAEQFFGEESRLDDFRLDRLRGLNTPVVVESDAPADSE